MFYWIKSLFSKKEPTSYEIKEDMRLDEYSNPIYVVRAYVNGEFNHEEEFTSIDDKQKYIQHLLDGINRLVK